MILLWRSLGQVLVDDTADLFGGVRRIQVACRQQVQPLQTNARSQPLRSGPTIPPPSPSIARRDSPRDKTTKGWLVVYTTPTSGPSPPLILASYDDYAHDTISLGIEPHASHLRSSGPSDMAGGALKRPASKRTRASNKQ